MAISNSDRKSHLLPNGIPRYVRCYDNEEESADRYTVVYTGRYRDKQGWFQYVGMSASPYHPQGVAIHGEHHSQIDSPNGKWPPAMGRKCHLGKRIPFSLLPEDCRTLVVQDYKVIWGIE